MTQRVRFVNYGELRPALRPYDVFFVFRALERKLVFSAPIRSLSRVLVDASLDASFLWHRFTGMVPSGCPRECELLACCVRSKAMHARY